MDQGTVTMEMVAVTIVMDTVTMGMVSVTMKTVTLDRQLYKWDQHGLGTCTSRNVHVKLYFLNKSSNLFKA